MAAVLGAAQRAVRAATVGRGGGAGSGWHAATQLRSLATAPSGETGQGHSHGHSHGEGGSSMGSTPWLRQHVRRVDGEGYSVAMFMPSAARKTALVMVRQYWCAGLLTFITSRLYTRPPHHHPPGRSARSIMR